MSAFPNTNSGHHPRGSRRTELTEAVLEIAADRGLERASVREVASAAGVSIGTVQHYFATKDEMLVFAFESVVGQVLARVAGRAEIGHEAVSRRVALSLALRELLPLDARRMAEVRVCLAFAARASVSPPLAAIQRRTLDMVHGELVTALSTARESGEAPPDLDPPAEARALLALVDGLAMHAVSAPDRLDPATLTDTLDRHLARLLPGRDEPQRLNG